MNAHSEVGEDHMKTKNRRPSGNKQPKKKRSDYRQRRYNDAERLAAITLAKDIGIRTAATKLGIPHETVEAWAKGWRCNESLQLWTASAGKLAEVLHKAAWDCLAELPGKIEDANLGQLMGAVKTAVNAERLLRGIPTSINENTSAAANFNLSQLTPEQRAALRELLNVARSATPNSGTTPETVGLVEEAKMG